MKWIVEASDIGKIKHKVEQINKMPIPLTNIDFRFELMKLDGLINDLIEKAVENDRR